MHHDALRWIEAGAAEDGAVLASMRAFYAEERLMFSDTEAQAAVRRLLARPELGRIFLLGAKGDAVDAKGGGVAGHLVLTWGFSLEFGGRFVLLDELYVARAWRGNGWGRIGIEFAAAWTREQGATSIRLEVSRANTRAQDIYRRSGFRDDERASFTRGV
jgi:GNAT superfamily N-acetyltransferase